MVNGPMDEVMMGFINRHLQLIGGPLPSPSARASGYFFINWRGDGPKSGFLPKTKTFVFWHIAEISARYRRQNDRTDVAHLFCFHKIIKNHKNRSKTHQSRFLGGKKAPAGMSRGQSQVFKIKTVHLRYLKATIGDIWKLLSAISESYYRRFLETIVN